VRAFLVTLLLSATGAAQSEYEALRRQGRLALERGSYAEAETALKAALDRSAELGGEDRRRLASLHADLATELTGLARFYMSQKRWLVAEPHLGRALAILEWNFGLQDARLLPALDPLAAVELELMKLADAETVVRRALSIRERTSGPMHVDVASTLDSLAVILYKQKRYPDAEAASARSLVVWKSVLSEEHPLLAISFDNLAVAQAAQNNHQDAAGNYRQALAIREAGALRSIHNLAIVASAQGRPRPSLCIPPAWGFSTGCPPASSSSAWSRASERISKAGAWDSSSA